MKKAFFPFIVSLIGLSNMMAQTEKSYWPIALINHPVAKDCPYPDIAVYQLRVGTEPSMAVANTRAFIAMFIAENTKNIKAKQIYLRLFLQVDQGEFTQLSPSFLRTSGLRQEGDHAIIDVLNPKQVMNISLQYPLVTKMNGKQYRFKLEAVYYENQECDYQNNITFTEYYGIN